jgi:putative addiction module CopG family antidote
MEATRRLQLDLPEDVAADIEARVASGEYESESAVVRAALEKLIEREEAEEAWLRTTVAARIEALDKGDVRTKTADEVRASLAARRASHDRAA